MPSYIKEIAISMLPYYNSIWNFQLVSLETYRQKSLENRDRTFVYIYRTCTFSHRTNVGFMPAGNYLGKVLASLNYKWILVPIGALIGYFIVKAEPAAYVLNHQVEEITDGAISAKAMGISLSVGVALSVALATVRVLWGFL